MPVGGFTTRELREHGQRVGFVVQAIDGSSAVIAHVDWTSSPEVGRYHVDVMAFEAVALPALERARERGGVIVVDELGRMELASAAFVTEVHDLLTQDVALIATVHEARHPVTDALKRRTDIEHCFVTRKNRDELPALLRARLFPDCPAL